MTNLVLSLQANKLLTSSSTSSNRREQPTLDTALAFLGDREKALASISQQVLFTKNRFLEEQQRTSLLRDLRQHYFPEASVDNPDEAKMTIYARIKLTGIALAGTIANICNGFDSSVSILTLFVGIPLWVVFLVGLAFSLIYVVLFYGIDFISISDNLHLRLSKSMQLLDEFVQQATWIQDMMEQGKKALQKDAFSALRAYQCEPQAAPFELEKIKKIHALLSALEIQQSRLLAIRQHYLEALEQHHVRFLKGLLVAIAALLYFNSGFFVGQVFASVLLSAFIVSPISLTWWPILLVSCVAGVATLFGTYWFSGRFDIENLVGRWIGLDIDKIRQLPDDIEVHETQACLAQAKSVLLSDEGSAYRNVA